MLMHATTWVKLNDIMISEIKPGTEEQILYDSIGDPKMGKIRETEVEQKLQDSRESLE